MNCNEISDKLSLYIDDELSSEEMKQVEEHLNSCENCQKVLDEYRNLISVLKNLPEEEPPEGYCERLHEKLLATGSQAQNKGPVSKIKGFNRSKWLKYGSIAAALVLVVAVAGINNMGRLGMKAENQSAYDMATAESPAEYYGGAPAPSSAPQPETAMPEEAAGMEYDGDYKYNRGELSYQSDDSIMITSLKEQKEMKIIKTGTISAQTEDYDKFLNDLSMKVNSLGGFLESNNTEVYQVYNEKNADVRKSQNPGSPGKLL